MIQRIQTVYLAVGAVLVAATPFAGALGSGPASGPGWFVPAIGLGLGFAFLTAVASIFLYGRRERQRSVVVVAQLLTLATLVALFVGRRGMDALPGAEATSTADWLLFILPVLAYVLFFLARRAIDRDIRLLKSVDRLR